MMDLRRWHPRGALLLFVAVAWLLPVASLEAQPREEPVIVISRDRVLKESAPAERLNEAEATMTSELRTRVDAIKAELAAEEEELTRLRASLPREEFERRVQSFDQRVRRERERTQRRAAALQTAFRQARQKLVEALVPILVTVSREMGAKLVLDRDQIVLAHPSIDVTERVIAMMDEQVPTPELPTLEKLEPPTQDAGTTPAPSPAPAE